MKLAIFLAIIATIVLGSLVYAAVAPLTKIATTLGSVSQ